MHEVITQVIHQTPVKAKSKWIQRCTRSGKRLSLYYFFISSPLLKCNLMRKNAHWKKRAFSPSLCNTKNHNSSQYQSITPTQLVIFPPCKVGLQEKCFLLNVRPSYPRTQHLRVVGGQVEHYLYWWANHLHPRMDLQSSGSCSALWKSVILTLWKSLEIATVYIAKYHFLKSVPLSEDLWIPQLDDGKLAKEKLSK